VSNANLSLLANSLAEKLAAQRNNPQPSVAFAIPIKGEPSALIDFAFQLMMEVQRQYRETTGARTATARIALDPRSKTTGTLSIVPG
jgi:hypothetical protein